MTVYAEFAPLVLPIVDTVMRLHSVTSDPVQRANLVECGIMIPLRLNHSLPHLPRLLRPVILGLRMRGERSNITAIALKSLEYWVDNLHPSFLEQVFKQEPTLHADLFEALTALLRVAGGTDSSTFRVLGKLGGLNRLHLAAPPQLQQVRYTEDGLRVRALWRATEGGIEPADNAAEGLDIAAVRALVRGGGGPRR